MEIPGFMTKHKQNLKLIMSAAVDRAVAEIVEARMRQLEPEIVQHVIDRLNTSWQAQPAAPLVPRFYNGLSGP